MLLTTNPILCVEENFWILCNNHWRKSVHHISKDWVVTERYCVYCAKSKLFIVESLY